MRSGGELLVACLERQGVDRVFGVPGESYLAVLDALHDSPIDPIIPRHEGGAAMMAEADGKLTERPGIAIVTRGPGATNAAAGVHIAKQDSTPMVLFVGQIARRMRGREAFQEVDYRQTFRDIAKWVEEIDFADRIPEIISHAWHVAMSGRPGPVVLALPEDMLRDKVQGSVAPIVRPADPGVTNKNLSETMAALRAAAHPAMLLGGSRWTVEARNLAEKFATKHQLPTAVTFRRQHLFDPMHACYAGDLGLGANPALVNLLKESDCLLLVGGRLSENPSQNFTLLEFPKPQQTLIHVHPGAEELGRIYAPTVSINASPEAFFQAALRDVGDDRDQSRARAAHQSYLAWSAPQPRDTHGVDMAHVMQVLRDIAPDATITNGAGNYAIWVQRYWRYRRYGSQLAPISGSMGYGLPAAIAASLRDPSQTVICFAGDGCFQMTSQEFGAAIQFGARPIVIVADNGMYGTIRMHQERSYPGRPSGTTIVNPDFAAIARAYGGHGETVANNADFAPAFERSLKSGRAALIHVALSPDHITPTSTLGEMRRAARESRNGHP